LVQQNEAFVCGQHSDGFENSIGSMDTQQKGMYIDGHEGDDVIKC